MSVLYFIVAFGIGAQCIDEARGIDLDVKTFPPQVLNYSGVDQTACERLSSFPWIRLRFNQLQQFPDECLFTKAKGIFLEGNNLTHIPKQIFESGNLKQLFLGNNPISSIDLTTCNSKIVRFRENFKSISEDGLLIVIPARSKITILIGKRKKLNIRINDDNLANIEFGRPIQVGSSFLTFAFDNERRNGIEVDMLASRKWILSNDKLLCILHGHFQVDDVDCSIISNSYWLILKNNNISEILEKCEFQQANLLHFSDNNLTHIPRNVFENRELKYLSVAGNPVRTIDLREAKIFFAEFSETFQLSRGTLILIPGKSNITVLHRNGELPSISVNGEVQNDIKCNHSIQVTSSFLKFECDQERKSENAVDKEAVLRCQSTTAENMCEARGRNYSRIDREACEALSHFGIVFLNANQLREIPEACSFSEAYVVDLSHNKLSHIPSQLFQNDRLKILYVTGNPILTIDLTSTKYTSVEFAESGISNIADISIIVPKNSNITVYARDDWNGEVIISRKREGRWICGQRFGTNSSWLTFECWNITIKNLS